MFSTISVYNSKKKGIEFDTRTKLQVIQDLRAKQVNVVPSFNPFLLIKFNGLPNGETLYPFGGLANKLTVLCNESGEYVFFKSDRYGLNNYDSILDQNKSFFALVGDSFAQGYCVKPEENIAGIISDITGEVVINYGTGGNGPLTNLAVLKEYVEAKKPKFVFWIYYEGNDLADLNEEKNSLLLMNYLRDGFTQNLILRQEEIENRLSNFFLVAENEAIEYSKSKKAFLKLLKFLALSNLRTRIGITINPIKQINKDLLLFSKIMKKAKNRVNDWGGELIFVYLPTYSRYTESVDNHNLYMQKSEVMSFVEELKIPIVDIHSKVFLNHLDPLSLFPFRMNAHYTKEGYRKIAEVLVSNSKIIEND